MKRMTSFVGKGFTPVKCKTQLRLGSSRIKLLRNKKFQQIAVDRKVVADFLRNGHESNARLQVEHIIREQNLIEAYDLLYLYAERIAAQLSVIDSQKTCPPDLKEDISTLLYASSRCAELPDFAQIRPMFIAKYGKEFVSTIEELRPGCGVNGKVIEKLSVSRPSGEAKLELMKKIAAEHQVDWDPASFEKELRAGPQDLLEGPSKIVCFEDLNEFPTVPIQKPILTESDHSANSGTSGRFMEEKEERKTSASRPGTGDDFRTGSQNGKSGPPARKPPGRSAEDSPFDSNMNPGATETLPRRSSRRESDIFPAPSRPHQEEPESRRNSIGVPGEKNGRVNTATVIGGIDEEDLSPPREYSRHNRRGSIDEFDGSHWPERRQSQKHDGKKHSAEEDDHGGIAKSRPGADAGGRIQGGTVSGSGKPRSQKQGPDSDEDYYRRVPSREKERDQDPGEQILKKAPSREGSGKGRTRHEGEYVDEQNLRRASSKEGSRSKIHPSSGEEGRRSKEGSQGKYRRHEYSSEDADHVPEPPRQRDSRKNASKYVDDDYYDPDYDSELFKKSDTTRTPRNPEDEYRDSLRGPRREPENWKAGVSEEEYRDASRGTRRESQNWKAGVSEEEHRDSSRGTRRESQNWKAEVSPRGDYSPRAGYDNGRRPHADDTIPVKRFSNLSVQGRKENERSGTFHHDSSEYEDDPRGVHGGDSRKNNLHTVDRSSESGEEGPSRSRQRKDAQEGSSKGRRSGREDPVPRNSRYDNDESLYASSRTDKRMSLPGEQPKNRSSDAYVDIGRRATMGPAEINRGARESEDPLRREKQKQSDRRQSAPFSKDDAMEGRQSSSNYASQRDRPSGNDDDRPPRFLTPKADERPERPRKNAPAEYDDDKPLPHLIKVGKQDNPNSSKTSTSSTPRPQPAPLQSHKSDPDLPKTTKAGHRKSQSATVQPIVKVPDLDHFLGIFGDKGGKWKK